MQLWLGQRLTEPACYSCGSSLTNMHRVSGYWICGHSLSGLLSEAPGPFNPTQWRAHHKMYEAAEGLLSCVTGKERPEDKWGPLRPQATASSALHLCAGAAAGTSLAQLPTAVAPPHFCRGGAALWGQWPQAPLWQQQRWSAQDRGSGQGQGQGQEG